MNFLTTQAKLGLLLITSFLTACGDGGGSDSNISGDQPKANQVSYGEISGTAFSNTVLTSAHVTALCKNGSGFKSSVNTNDKGEWKGEVDKNQFPCRIEINTNTQQYHGYAVKEGNVNINPLTDVVIANASTQIPTVWYKSGTNIDETKLKSSSDDLIKGLKNKGYDVDDSSNFFGKKLDETSKEFQIVKDLFSAIEKSTTIEDFNALLLLLKDGNFSQIPQKIAIGDNLPNLEINSNACIKQDDVNYDHCNSTFINDFTESQLITPMGEPCTLTKVNDKLMLSNGKVTISTYLNGEEQDLAVIPSANVPGDSILLYAGNSDGVGVNFGYSISRKQIMVSGAGSQKENDSNSLVCSTIRK